MSGNQSPTAGSSVNVSDENVAIAANPSNVLSTVPTQSLSSDGPNLHFSTESLNNLPQEYDSAIAEIATAASDLKFREELTTIEHWFKVLSKSEQTASIYALMQHWDQNQMRFFVAALQKMLASDSDRLTSEPTGESQVKTKSASRGLRPPSLNLPLLGLPSTPLPGAAISANRQASTIQDTPVSASHDKLNWANLVSTPAMSMFSKQNDDGKNASEAILTIPGFGQLNPQALNMVANSGLSAEAQLLAMQLVMSGAVQPAGMDGHQLRVPLKSSKKQAFSYGRTPTSAKYPGSALRHSSLRSSGLKSAGLKSAGLRSAGLDSGSMATPKEEDFNPEVLKDIPAWLRSLRLHKYTSCFDGMTWQEMVALDDAGLETKGIATLGARRRLLRTFEIVRKVMGIEDPSSATPTTSALTGDSDDEDGGEAARVPPKSAAPTMVTSRLSASSPVFVPSREVLRVPQSAAATVSMVTGCDDSE
ncbi:hypothetical protein AX17_005818 [Amanita inopinata Kibby_2008]|nr:hypothetical protein AX17_005818 [Amanita inopinata Kibby_2008]